nr:Transthyretin domain containing protein [Haemonchus contortus]
MQESKCVGVCVCVHGFIGRKRPATNLVTGIMRPEFLLIFALIPSCTALLGIIGREQSVAVTGRLICEGRPAGDVKVKLYDKELFFDSKLDEVRTNRNGEFRVSGHKREITTIDPKVNIYHKCNYNGFCYKKLSITIPDNFVSDGALPRATYDIGTINLANKFKGESIDCIN